MIDQVWIAALYEEGQAIRKEEHQEQPSTLHAHSSTQPSTSTYTTEDPARLELMHEMQLQRPVYHEGGNKILCGSCDYSLWYESSKNPNSLTTNLLMIEGKRSYDAMPQLAAYMGMVHAARKEDWKPNGVVYGIATNGVESRFCRLDDHGVFYDTPMLEWKNNADRIFSRMRAIIQPLPFLLLVQRLLGIRC